MMATRAGCAFRVGGVGLDVTFAEGCLHDGRLVLAYRHRFAATELQDATLLTKGGADAAGELGEVAGLLQHVVGFAPAALREVVLPLGLAVAQRTRPVAEGHAAVHAARCLPLAVAAIQGLFDLAEIVDAFMYGPVTGFLPVYGKECFRISHVCILF